MIFLYLISLFMIGISFQRILNVKQYLLVIVGLTFLYFILSFELIDDYQLNDYISFYDYLLNKYFPYISALIISLYIRYEQEKKRKVVDTLENNINIYHDKSQRLLHIVSRMRREKRDLEKRIISEEKESIKIREIMTEINNYNIEDIEHNILKYFKMISPSAELRFYKNNNGLLKLIDSTFKSLQNKGIVKDSLYNYIFNRNEDISSSLDYKDEFQEKIIITLRLGEKEIFGVILIDEIEFFELNKVTIQGLYYFVELLSLQIEKTLVYQKQKETSYSYNYKNIYNIHFLKKILYHELHTAKRHNLDSAAIKITSKDFKNTAEDLLFEEVEEFYNKFLRKTDLMFYNQEDKSFVFIFPITKMEKVKFIQEKISNNFTNYYIELSVIYITKHKKANELFHIIGIE